MILLNCDIGERGPHHSLDDQLMQTIHIANIACGGHAGDARSIAWYRELAEKYKVSISAHLSYPDRDHFGRVSMDISPERLESSLDEQYTRLSDIKMIKFHGALYNDACKDQSLASLLTRWLLRQDIGTVLTLPGSELDKACTQAGITVMREAFAERRYCIDPDTGKLSLVSRDKVTASIQELEEAREHAENIIHRHQVEAIMEDPDGQIKYKWVGLTCDTLCIHSDSEIALELARRLYPGADHG